MRILIIANNDVGLFKFRKELLKTLAEEHEVHISLPQGEYISALEEMGCAYHPCTMDRHGKNPLQELQLMGKYFALLRTLRPDVVLTYTIKPNIYGGILCSVLKIPYIVNITGLGIAVENESVLQKVLLGLYKCSLRRARMVFFQNQSNLELFKNRGIVRENVQLLPGSGVNLLDHPFEEYPSGTAKIILLVIGRIMKDKGSDEVLYAAENIHREYPDVCLRLLGSYDGDYEDKVKEAVARGYLEYMGQQSDVHAFIKESSATVHASYHEGMSNVLLETAASGRPVIATDVPGCIETYDPGVSGISCRARDAESLTNAIRTFLSMSHQERAEMGVAGRRKMEQEFDRNTIILRYKAELQKIQTEKSKEGK